MSEIDARHVRTELDRRGWVEWISPRVAELDEGRRATFVRADALVDLAAASGLAAPVIAHRAPVREADVLARIPRIAAVTGVNRLLSDLAGQLRAQGEVDACSLPIRRQSAGGPSVLTPTAWSTAGAGHRGSS